MSLTDTVIRNAKPKDKSYKLSDQNGMYLLIHRNGGKYFRIDYRFEGKRKTLALGTYPEISLKEARNKVHTVKKQIADGIDPCEIKKAVKADSDFTFEKIARRWLASQSHIIKPETLQKKQRQFEIHVFDRIGGMLIAEVKSPDVFAVVKPLIEKNNLETAHRTRAEISSVFAYAIAHGFCEYDPAQPISKQIPALKAQHHAAITEPRDVARLMRNLHAYDGTFVVQCALKISPLLFQRPGEIRQMQWCDIDLEAREWRYLVTKTDVQHIVPLSKQVIDILEAIRPLTGHGRYVFPSARGDGRPMSDGAVRTALRTLGYDKESMSAHGFRSLASTLLNEQGWSPDAIERQLCHMPKDGVRAAYNRAQYLDERRRMMQSWADYLDGLKDGGEVIPIRKQR